MTVKRKISVRKVLQVGLTLVVAVACIVAIVSAAKVENRKAISGIEVTVNNDPKYHVTEQKVLKEGIMTQFLGNDALRQLGKVDLKAIARFVSADPWVDHAEVFIDNNKLLHLNVDRRIPIARLFFQDGTNDYMDSARRLMTPVAGYAYYAPVFTNVPNIGSDSASMALLRQMAVMAKTIQGDTFWSAQISQIVVDSGGTFELIPVIGSHRILFGDTANAHRKLTNLFVFYKNVLNRIGWDRYQTLDVRFKDQVVASPSLPYHAPVDKVNLSWIGAMLDSNRKDGEKSAHAPLAIADTMKGKAAKPKTDPKPNKVKSEGKPVAKKGEEKAKATADKKGGDSKQAEPKRDKTKKDKDAKISEPKYLYKNTTKN
jgi:cell division protein FtsQ